MQIVNSSDDFIVVGENIHATRIVLRNGKRSITLDNGNEVVLFKDKNNKSHELTVPESYKKRQPYKDGHIKHFMIAVEKAMTNDSKEVSEGSLYIESEILRQERKGAKYIDLNIDEISHNKEIQIKAMEWLVTFSETIASVPLSIDSSNPEIIEAGLKKHNLKTSPMINSAALERIDILDLVKKYQTKVIITAAGSDGMPSNSKERIENSKLMLNECNKRNISLSDIFIDPLVFPISVDKSYGLHYLDTVQTLRKEFGKNLHITGGLSNVSFGLPKRKLINDSFIRLSIEYGIDSGIIDPIQSNIEQILQLDLKKPNVNLATKMLLGEDEFCINYISAFRNGDL
tara:strand:+ start:575 stop:1606 length:1032 start_codon:yes stop_codon:yes gene_type:complete